MKPTIPLNAIGIIDFNALESTSLISVMHGPVVGRAIVVKEAANLGATAVQANLLADAVKDHQVTNVADKAANMEGGFDQEHSSNTPREKASPQVMKQQQLFTARTAKPQTNSNQVDPTNSTVRRCVDMKENKCSNKEIVPVGEELSCIPTVQFSSP